MNGSILQVIGNTPLVLLSGYMKKHGLGARIFAKFEGANPFGSVKDRAALFMLQEAEIDGRLKPGMTIVEPTSGNTGIGLAAVGAIKGYRVVLTMPDTMTVERRSLLAAHGAELVLTPGSEGLKGAVARARELVADLDGFMPDQFSNPANARAHYEGTGPEIWRELEGKVDAFVAGVGSGGTVTGVGQYLRCVGSDARIVAVEPAESPVLSGGVASAHKIQGIGAGFVPGLLDREVIDEIIQVKSEDAIRAAAELSGCEGVLVGPSGGAALTAAATLAARPEFAEKTIVTLFPDLGERYMSTGMFDAK